MISNTLKWTLLALLVVLPGAALAQCAGMGSGGHQHDAESASKSSEKDARIVRDILKDEDRRGILLEGMLEDAGFMQLVIDRIADTPKLREMAVQSFGTAGGEQVARPDGRKSKESRMKAEQKSMTYTCPMHPEVKSDKPGKCPKCGMTLQRVEPSGHTHDDSSSKGN